MQRLIPILAFLLTTISLIGQPVITSEVLPRVGDTILMASDNLPENVAILGRGENQSWDLMSLQSAFTQKVAITTTNQERTSIPFKTSGILMQEINGVKSFFESDGHSLSLLGTIGLDPMNIGVQTTTFYNEPIETVHFPLKYGEKKKIQGDFSFKISIEDLPKDILYTLPITPDSVRYRCTLVQEKEIDGWGTLALPDNTYDVLREKVVEERTYRVDIKVGSLPWQDITEAVDDPKIQKKQLSESFHFYSNETTSKVAVAYMKPNGVNPELVYYTVTDPSSTMRTASNRPDIYAYPNPAINNVRFEFSNLKPSNYSLKIYNILGVVVMQENYTLNGFKTKKIRCF